MLVYIVELGKVYPRSYKTVKREFDAYELLIDTTCAVIRTIRDSACGSKVLRLLLCAIFCASRRKWRTIIEKYRSAEGRDADCASRAVLTGACVRAILVKYLLKVWKNFKRKP